MKQMLWDKKIFIATGFGKIWRCLKTKCTNPEFGSSHKRCVHRSVLTFQEGQGKEKTEERGREAAQGEEEGTDHVRHRLQWPSSCSSKQTRQRKKREELKPPKSLKRRFAARNGQKLSSYIAGAV